MADRVTVRLRRTGERRSRITRRVRPEYEVVITVGGVDTFHTTTVAPSAALVRRGRVHTTDSYEWMRAADTAYSHGDPEWITDPFAVRDE